MPQYDYKCLSCNKRFTAKLTLEEHEAGAAKCPKCGKKKLEKLIGGFYAQTSKKS